MEMATRLLLLLLCLAAAANSDVLQTDALSDDKTGFISVDCGHPGKTGYIDEKTQIWYVPDADFTDAGSNHNITDEYITPPGLSRRYRNVRSFPAADGGARSCYTLRPIAPMSKYLLRAEFKYGNYDGLSHPPVFHLHAGANFWTTVNVTDADTAVMAEAIVFVPDNSTQVCLVNIGSGTPFISGLELRPVRSTLYPQVTQEQGLLLLGRLNFGPSLSDEDASALDPTAPLLQSSGAGDETKRSLLRSAART